ncbi:hypothetical protein [Vibrio superstes]|nr:hypothetical protein [Vibrio superstes]
MIQTFQLWMIKQNKNMKHKLIPSILALTLVGCGGSSSSSSTSNPETPDVEPAPPVEESPKWVILEDTVTRYEAELQVDGKLYENMPIPNLDEEFNINKSNQIVGSDFGVEGKWHTYARVKTASEDQYREIKFSTNWSAQGNYKVYVTNEHLSIETSRSSESLMIDHVTYMGDWYSAYKINSNFQDIYDRVNCITTDIHNTAGIPCDDGTLIPLDFVLELHEKSKTMTHQEMMEIDWINSLKKRE